MTKKVHLLKKNEKVPLTYDEASKIFFSSPNHLEPLAILLSCILEENYEDILKRINLITTYVHNSHLGEKKTNRDICLKLLKKDTDDLDSKLLIEINISPNKQQVTINRNVYYQCEVFSNGLPENETYDKILPTIQINLNNFFVNKKKMRLFDEYSIRNIDGDEMTDILKFHQINIEKCYKFWYTKNVPEFSNHYKMNLFYLCAAMCTKKVSEFNELIDMLEVSDEAKEIMKEMSKEMNSNNDFVVRYFDPIKEQERINKSMLNAARTEGHKSGVNKGITLGRAEGKEQKEKEMVVNFYKEKVPVDVIAKCANISREKVLKIVKAI